MMSLSARAPAESRDEAMLPFLAFCPRAGIGGGRRACARSGWPREFRRSVLCAVRRSGVVFFPTAGEWRGIVAAIFQYAELQLVGEIKNSFLRQR